MATTLTKPNAAKCNDKKIYLGWIPEGWETASLEKVTKSDKPIVYGIVQAGPHIPEGVPYIKSADVGREIKVENLQKTSFEIAKKYHRAEIKPGDIVFSLRGNIGEMSIVPSTLSSANLTQGTARISVDDRHSTIYVKYAISGPVVEKEIAKISKGSTFREISLAQLRAISILLPPRIEQEYIASILTAWDKAIQKTEDLITFKTKNFNLHRSRLTQQLNLRNTQEKSLSEIATEVIRKNNGSDAPIMMISSTKGFIDQSEKYDREMVGDSLSKYILLENGEFAYNKGNSKTYPYGCVFRLDLEKALIPFVYYCFRFNENIEPRFYRHYFEVGSLNKQLKPLISSSARGNGLLNINRQDFFSCKIPVPPIEYQKVCADFLDYGLQEIQLLKKQVELYKEQKKGLMQQLLTGKVRVKV